jgi:hypothetical protein
MYGTATVSGKKAVFQLRISSKAWSGLSSATIAV